MKKHLGDLLVEANIISVKTLERALERQEGTGKRLGLILEEMGVINDDELVAALAKQLGLKTVSDIASHTFSEKLIALVPEDLAVQKLIFPLKHNDEMLALATTDPFDSDTLDFLIKKTGLKIIPVLSTRKDIVEAINKHYLHSKIQQTNKMTVLVVDDSPAIGAVIKSALLKEGYNVIVAIDGIEGLKVAFSQKIDLIICDAVMPRMDGYALFRALKGNPATAKIPVILLTSKASPEEEQRALKSGFQDFIAKPVMPIRVISRVKKALETK